MLAGEGEAVLVHGASVPRVPLSGQGSLDRCPLARVSRELTLLAQVHSLHSLCHGPKFDWTKIRL